MPTGKVPSNLKISACKAEKGHETPVPSTQNQDWKASDYFTERKATMQGKKLFQESLKKLGYSQPSNNSDARVP